MGTFGLRNNRRTVFRWGLCCAVTIVLTVPMLTLPLLGPSEGPGLPPRSSMYQEVTELLEHSRRGHRSTAVRVCLVTGGLVGPTQNSGIATAYTSLALFLSEAGHNVTVLYSAGQYTQSSPVTHWQLRYAAYGVELVPLPSTLLVPIIPNYNFPLIHETYAVYEWLLARDGQFDVVFFHEWRTSALFAARARRTGIAFPNTIFVANFHSPTLFIVQSSHFIDSLSTLAVTEIERMSVEAADIVTSPANFTLQWALDKGWKLPSRRFMVPNLVPPYEQIRTLVETDNPPLSTAKWPDNAPSAPPMDVHELVFMGRLESLKGIELFCDALDRLASYRRRVSDEHLYARLTSLTITFLGRAERIENEKSEAYIQRRSVKWPFHVQLLTNYATHSAQAYVRKHGRLVVVASRMETSPYVVLECIIQGVPVLAPSVGGIPELLAPESRDLLFPRSAKGLTDVLIHVLERGALRGMARVTEHIKRQQWLDFVVRLGAEARQGTPPRPPTFPPSASRRSLGSPRRPSTCSPDEPLVSIIIPHYECPDVLRGTLESVVNQTYRCLDVTVVDDISLSETTQQALHDLESSSLFEDGWRILRPTSKGYQGGARNFGARQAAGDYVFFLDADDLLMPDTISVAVGAAVRTEADVVTGWVDCFEGSGNTPPTTTTGRWVPVGPSVALSLLDNAFGGAAGLWRLESFLSTGGFKHIVAYEDYELYVRAVLSGLRIELLPRPLYWYRTKQPHSALASTDVYLNRRQVLSTFLNATNPSLHLPLETLYGGLPGSLGNSGLL